MSTANVSNLSETWSSVSTRVSWGAILAGAAVGLATYTMLAMLGLAIGLSVSNEAAADSVSIGAAIWTFITILAAMFFAGWVTTQCTVGENQKEAMLYGVIVWAVTSSLLLWMTAAGVGLGYHAVSNRSSVNDRAASANATTVDRTAQANEQNRSNAEVDRRTRERMQASAWWTLGGMVLSIAAAIGGALLGPYEIVSRREYRRVDRPTGHTPLDG